MTPLRGSQQQQLDPITDKKAVPIAPSPCRERANHDKQARTPRPDTERDIPSGGDRSRPDERRRSRPRNRRNGATPYYDDVQTNGEDRAIAPS